MNEARAAKERSNLSKEIKIGISAIVVLLGVFGYVLYTKFFKKPAAPEVAAKAPVAAEAKPKQPLASGPAQPTVVNPQPQSATPSTTPPSTTTSSRTSRAARASEQPSSGNLTAPTTPSTSYMPSDDRGGRYRDRYASGPPSYDYSADDSTPSSTEGASSRHSTMATDPYAYSATPATTAPADPYALDEPQGPASTTSDGRGPARLAPAAGAPAGHAAPTDPYRSTTSSASTPPSGPSRDPYGRTTSRGTAPTTATQTPPTPPASSYSSARSYEMYGRTASGAPAPSTPPATTDNRQTPSSRPRATSVGFGASSNQGEIERSTDEYTVEPNDSYWTISQKLYGNGGYFKALFEHNREQFPRPDQLKPGVTISAPSTAALRQTYPDLCPSEEHAAVASQSPLVSTSGSSLASGAKVYVVEEGDTLFDIARFELGRASRWAEIYDLNRDQIGQNVDYLRPGLELMLPHDASDTSFTRRPQPTRQR